jgi:flagellar motor switch protein FliG
MLKDLSQEEKGALFLKSLAPQIVESVLARLGPDRRDRLRSLMQRLPEEGHQEHLEGVLREFEVRLLTRNVPTTNPDVPANGTANVSEADSGSATAKNEEPGDPLTALASLDTELLIQALEGENPRSIFLLLNHMPVENAGELFKRLPGKLRREISLQFTNPVIPGREVLAKIAQGVHRKSRILKETPKEPGPEARYRKMADMIRLLEREERKEVLVALEERDAAAAAAVKSQLYQFEDLLNIENRSMQKLLAELDTKNLALALKNAEADIKEKVLHNMSQRAQETLKEEMEFSQTTTSAQIQQAQKVVVETIQRLDQAGDLVMIQE